MKKIKVKSLMMKTLTGAVVSVFVVMLMLPVIGADTIYDQLKKFEYVVGLVMKNYFEDVDNNKLMEGAISGMLQNLDPHSAYLSAKDMEEVNADMGGSFEGIGVSFNVQRDTIIVDAPIIDGPSEKIGILPRDRIVKCNGISLIGLTQDSIYKLLRGKKGTIAELEIFRPSARSVLTFNVIRDKVPLNSVVASFMVDDEIGVIQLNRYSATTTNEFIEHANKLKSEGMKKLILDLRGNPGGMLDQAQKLCDQFLKGDTIVYTHGRVTSDDQILMARPGQPFEDMPLIVLIDGGSASASEITAGAVQDLDRGLVVGITSFGKGLVQRQFPIYSDGSAVRVTTARFYSASGRCIQRPFKDRESWKRMTDRLELDEGANLEHVLDKIKKEDSEKGNKKDKIDLDSIEIFYTRAGRPVLGGGGITPDYVIKYDTSNTLTKMTAQLRYKGVLLSFYDKIRDDYSKYKNDYEKFMKEYTITDKQFKILKELAKENDVEWNEDDFEKDRDYITNWQIRFQIVNGLWNRSMAMKSSIEHDRQLKKATELFPLAIKIQDMKRK